MNSDDPLGMLAAAGNAGDGQRRRIRAEYRVFGDDKLETGKEIALHVKILDDRFDDQCAIAKRFQRRSVTGINTGALETDALAGSFRLGGSQASLLDRACQALLDRAGGAVERSRSSVVQDDADDRKSRRPGRCRYPSRRRRSPRLSSRDQECAPYSPVKCGFRFSRKAATPSTKSLVSPGLALQIRLEIELGVEIVGHRRVESPLGQGKTSRRHRSHLGRENHCFLQQRIGGGHAVNDTYLIGANGADPFARHHQRRGTRQTDDARQKESPAAVRHESDFRERLNERRVFSGKHDVAGEWRDSLRRRRQRR